MRTDEAKLSKFFINADKVLGENKHAVLAAMKEAREEYAKGMFKWFQELIKEDRTLVDKYVDSDKEEFKLDLIISCYNTHLSAIEAEKERGKGCI